jgi:hypothetical protein
MEAYVEYDKELFCGCVIASKVREATKEEIEIARQEFANDNCKHRLHKDEAGFMYIERKCAFCGEFLDYI